MGGVPVEPAEVALVDGLHVVVDGAVVAPAGRRVGERRRQLELLGRLDHRPALVGQPHRLVVQVAVEVALGREVLEQVGAAPAGPVVAGEQHVAVGAEQVDRLVQVLAPRQGVAHLRASRRVQVVERAGAVLGHAQHAVVGEVEVHLRGRLGVRRDLEDDADAVDDQLGPRGLDVLGRGHETLAAEQRHALAQAGVDVTERAPREEGAVHVGRPTGHGRPGDDVLADRGVEEAGRRDDAHPAGVDVGLVDHAVDAGEVVDVGVGVDHRGDPPSAEVRLDEVEGRSGRVGRGQRVDDDPALGSLDHRQVRQVEAPHLVEAGRHLEQAGGVVQRRLPPQPGVDGLGGRAGDEGVGVEVPDREPVPEDLGRRRLGDPTPLGPVAVGRVVEPGRGAGPSVRRRGRGRGLLGCGISGIDGDHGSPFVRRRPRD